MGLVIKNTVTRNPAGSELYIEFYAATGLYSLSNTGGFGAPNPARNTLAMLFYGNHEKEDGDVLCVPVAYDPVTSTTFTIAITRDLNAVLHYFNFAVPIWDGSPGVDGDIVWDNTTTPSSPFVKKKISGVWTPIEISSLVDESSIVQKEGHAMPVPDIESYRDELNRARIDKLKDLIDEVTGADEYEPIRNDFDYVDGVLDMAVDDFYAGAYAEAEKKVEALLFFEDNKKAV